MTGAAIGRVYLVGAGPGDPELLTRKACRLLAEADVVLHDDLVSESIVSLASKQALVMSVGKRCGKKRISQAAIHELMVSSAQRGLMVVRLKSGDPMIFGRAGEEMDALRAAQIPFEVVPGVTAASSAAALLGASLTDRRIASKLIVLSGHPAAGEPTNRQLFSSVPPEDATIAIYMPGNDLSQVTASLLRSGLSEAIPCVAVSDASRSEASYTAFRLGLFQPVLPSPGPRLLLVGRAFEDILNRESQADSSLAQIADLASSIHPE
jgi:uroporphyrin-III C-methyltransferase